MGSGPSRLYTRTGDKGTTALATGGRIEKSSRRIEVLGSIDELNSLIGVLEANGVPEDISRCLLDIQHRLLDIGSELAMPGSVIIDPGCVEQLEALIDGYNSTLPALREFILPGGSSSAALCHLARSVCRRMERTLVLLGRNEDINLQTRCYINRLSDLLFVIARYLNREQGGRDILWDNKR